MNKKSLHCIAEVYMVLCPPVHADWIDVCCYTLSSTKEYGGIGLYRIHLATQMSRCFATLLRWGVYICEGVSGGSGAPLIKVRCKWQLALAWQQFRRRDIAGGGFSGRMRSHLILRAILRAISN